MSYSVPTWSCILYRPGSFRLAGSLLFLLLQLCLGITVNAQTPVPLASQPNYSYTATFTDITSWTNNFSSGIEANRWASVATGGASSIPNPTRITTATNTFVTFSLGGVQRGVGTDAGKIVLLATGTIDNISSAAIDFFVNFTGLNAGRLQFEANTGFNGNIGDNRKGTLKVYASIDGTTFTDLAVDYVATNYTAGSATLSVALPASFNNAATARLRFYSFNGGTSVGAVTGARPKIAIDNVSVTGVGLTVSPTSLTGLNATCANPSVAQAYTLTGTNLTANVSVNAPTGFEVSKTSNMAGFAAAQTVAPSSGTVSQTLYVRRKAGLTPGSVSSAVSLSHTSSGAFSASLPLSGSTTPAPTPTVSTTAVTCLGGNDGVLSASASGGTGPYSFTLSTNATNSSGRFTGLSAGTYSVSVADGNGCASTVTNQTVANGISFTITAQNTTICSGIPANLTALVTAYNTYSNPVWRVGSPTGTVVATPNSVTPSASTTYYLVAQNPQSCTAQATVSVVVRPSPSVQITAVDVDCIPPKATIQTQVLGGAPPIGYVWTRAGAVGVVSTSASPSFTVSDTYTVVVTDANSCTSFASVVVATPNPIVSSLQLQQPLCNGGSGTATVTINGGSGDYSIDYTLFGNTSPDYTAISTSGVAAITSLPPGSYSIDITDLSLECILSLTATFTDPPALTLSLAGTDLLCNGAATGSVNSTIAGGTPLYGYAWSNGASTANPNSLTAGTYSLTVTDGNSCTVSQAISLTQPTAISPGTASLTAVKCFGAQTGAITIGGASGGVGPYSFTLSDGTTNTTGRFTDLAAGLYTVGVGDANGCTALLPVSVTVNQPVSLPVASLTPSETAVCNGINVTLTANGSGGTSGYLFDFGGGSSVTSTTVVTPALGRNTYSLTVTDANGCTSTASATVQGNAIPTATLSPTSATLTCAEPSVTLVASGGSGLPGDTFVFSGPGIVSQDASAGTAVVNVAGMYSVTVTTASGCTNVTTSTIDSDTALPTVSIAPTSGTLTCTNPSLTLTASGSGTTYLWSGGTTGASLSVIAPGTYTVTTMATNGCSNTATKTVISNMVSPSATLTPSSATLTCTQTSVTLTAGGGGSYSFSTGTTVNPLVVSSVGTYSVLVTAANGCTAAATAIVVSNTTAPTVTVTPSSTTFCGSLLLTASGTGIANVIWNTGATTPAITVTATGPYSLTATGANGCTTTASNSPTAVTGGLALGPVASSSSACEGGLVVVPVTVIGAASTFEWYRNGSLVSGQSSATLTLSPAQANQSGSYVLAATGGCGSATSTAFNLTVGSVVPTVVITFPNGSTVVVNNQFPTITLQSGNNFVMQASGGVFYEWILVLDRINGYEIRQSDSNITGIFSVNQTGPYKLTITGANGCKRTVEGLIQVR
jgi:hypothetical protein